MGWTKTQQTGDAADIAKTQRSSSAQAAHYSLYITGCALQPLQNATRPKEVESDASATRQNLSSAVGGLA